jgi:RNA polymerase sigma factor (sigma-70 family)
MDDASLIVKAQKDPQEFKRLYDKYVGKVFKYFFFHNNHDRETAEDMTQETFLKAFNHLQEYKEYGYTYGTYLLTIAHNILVNSYRKQPSVPLQEAGKVIYDISEKLEAESEQEALQKAIQELQPEEQLIVAMKYKEGRPIQDIAQLLHKNENTIKLALFRIRKKLKANKYLWA